MLDIYLVSFLAQVLSPSFGLFCINWFFVLLLYIWQEPCATILGYLKYLEEMDHTPHYSRWVSLQGRGVVRCTEI